MGVVVWVASSAHRSNDRPLPQQRADEMNYMGQLMRFLALFVLRKFILQTRMCRHPAGLDVWSLVGPFVYCYTLCVRTSKALARLRGCAGSPEPLLVAHAIRTIISWAGSNYVKNKNTKSARYAVNGWRRTDCTALKNLSFATCFVFLDDLRTQIAQNIHRRWH